jgi:tetratricopeptide (TPR) repeat protein
MNKHEIKYSLVNKINNINEIHLALEEATDERYYLKALNFFNNEEFEKAKDHFEKVVKYNIDDTKKMIEVCDKFILEPNMNYNEKADLLFSYNQFGLAKKYYEKDYNFELVAVMNLYQNNFENFEKVLSEKNLNIEQLYNKYDFAKQEIEKYFYYKTNELKNIYTTIQESTTKIVKELTNE